MICRCGAQFCYDCQARCKTAQVAEDRFVYSLRSMFCREVLQLSQVDRATSLTSRRPNAACTRSCSSSRPSSGCPCSSGPAQAVPVPVVPSAELRAPAAPNRPVQSHRRLSQQTGIQSAPVPSAVPRMQAQRTARPSARPMLPFLRNPTISRSASQSVGRTQGRPQNAAVPQRQLSIQSRTLAFQRPDPLASRHAVARIIPHSRPPIVQRPQPSFVQRATSRVADQQALGLQRAHPQNHP